MYSLLSRLRGGSAAAACIDIEVMLLPDGDLDATRHALDLLGAQLGVSFKLRPGPRAVLLMVGSRPKQMSPQLMNALSEGRPLVTLPRRLLADLSQPNGPMNNPVAALDLLHQFRLIPVLADRLRSLKAPEDATPAAWPPLLQQVVQCRKKSASQVMTASYGDAACMHFDFKLRTVLCDPLALEHLRLHRELPRPVGFETLQPNAVLRRLDHTLWDLGSAAGSLPLLNEAEDSPRAALCWTAANRVAAYSNRPMHLDAWRLLRSSPLTVPQLQRRLRTSKAELRQFLQAGLLAGLLQWHAVD